MGLLYLSEYLRPGETLENLNDYSAISARFKEGFQSYQQQKKERTVISAIYREFRNPLAVLNHQFVAEAVRRTPDQAEHDEPQSFFFISRNPEYAKKS